MSSNLASLVTFTVALTQIKSIFFSNHLFQVILFSVLIMLMLRSGSLLNFRRSINISTIGRTTGTAYLTSSRSKFLPLQFASDCWSHFGESSTPYGASQRSYSTARYAKKAKRSNARQGEDLFDVNKDPNWVTVKFGSDADQKKTEMEERIKGAAAFESRQLSQEETAELNRALGIEKEVMAALAAEDGEDDDDTADKSSSRRPKAGKREKQRAGAALRMPTLDDDQYEEALRVKGFLEVNPYVCSGCGTAFQSKNPDQPGYLDKEKLRTHRANAEKIREKQEAIKILEMAGIEIDSAAAQEVLQEASVPDDVITGVRALGRAQYDSMDMNMDGSALFGDDRVDEAFVNAADDEDEQILAQLDWDTDAVDNRQSNAAPADGDNQVSVRLDQVNEADDESTAGDQQLREIAEMLRKSGPPRSIKSEKKQKYASKKAADYSLLQEQLSKLDGIDGIINDIDVGTSGVTRFSVHKGGKQSIVLPNPSAEDSAAALEEDEAINIADELRDRKRFVNDNICICQRCFRLQQYGQVEESLRPGWSDNELLTPERFESLLTTVKDSPAVVLCLVDMFDLRGSLLPNLRQIAGKNPVVIAANKVDLLPKDASHSRISAWILAEAKAMCGFVSPKEQVRDLQQEMYEKRDGSHRRFGRRDGRYEMKRRLAEEDGVLRKQNVHLVSCQSGHGMKQLLTHVMSLAEDNGNKVFVMGAANVGKSSFINQLLEDSKSISSTLRGKKKGRKPAVSNVPQATVSNLPGTTLDFLKIKLPNGITMVDTPGLLSKGQLTSKLTTSELRQVIPAKPINAVTLRLQQGKCVLVGGLARIELIDGRPFFFTFFFSNEIKLRPTDSSKADAFVEKHIGDLVSPPDTIERLRQIGPFVEKVVEVSGESWRKSETDIVIAGLGWVSITGTGTAVVKVTVPEGTAVDTRPALLPYEAPSTAVRFTGGRLLRRTKKSKGAGQVKGYGWRA